MSLLLPAHFLSPPVAKGALFLTLTVNHHDNIIITIEILVVGCCFLLLFSDLFFWGWFIFLYLVVHIVYSYN